MKGHTDAIHCAAFSPDGTILASGGSDGMKLWDVHTQDQLVIPQPIQGMRGPVSCMIWATRRTPPAHLLCFGTGLGYMVIWCQRLQPDTFEEKFSRRLGTGCEITCVAWDASDETTTRVAIGTRDRFVQVWTIDSPAQPHSVFSIQLNPSVPRAIAFVDNAARDIYVFGLYNGHIHILRGDNGHIQSTAETGGYIAMVSNKRKQFVMDNAVDGFELREIETGNYIRTYPTGVPIKIVPKQVAFGEECKIAKTYEGEHASTIAGASSSNCGDISISLWIRKNKTADRLKKRGKTLTPNLLTYVAINILMLTAIITLTVQNLQYAQQETLLEQVRSRLAFSSSGGPRHFFDIFMKAGPEAAVHGHKAKRNEREMQKLEAET
ncbi:Protein Notchless [Grifola frondosa]|uniref:Protein Notchless n=1 Tax=Grifola frondosa TaxID=5627 RepID=A0A1C7LYL3_GRIFR|nr:Protein Notchless [Grifola frondosa]